MSAVFFLFDRLPFLKFCPLPIFPGSAAFLLAGFLQPLMFGLQSPLRESSHANLLHFTPGFTLAPFKTAFEGCNWRTRARRAEAQVNIILAGKSQQLLLAGFRAKNVAGCGISFRGHTFENTNPEGVIEQNGAFSFHLSSFFKQNHKTKNGPEFSGQKKQLVGMKN